MKRSSKSGAFRAAHLYYWIGAAMFAFVDIITALFRGDAPEQSRCDVITNQLKLASYSGCISAAACAGVVVPVRTSWKILCRSTWNTAGR